MHAPGHNAVITYNNKTYNMYHALKGSSNGDATLRIAGARLGRERLARLRRALKSEPRGGPAPAIARQRATTSRFTFFTSVGAAADHHLEAAGLDDALHLHVVEGQLVEAERERDLLRFARGQVDSPEALQLIHRPGDRADHVVDVELHHLVGGALAAVGTVTETVVLPSGAIFAGVTASLSYLNVVYDSP